jgi:hypothetical protein
MTSTVEYILIILLCFVALITLAVIIEAELLGTWAKEWFKSILPFY